MWTGVVMGCSSQKMVLEPVVVVSSGMLTKMRTFPFTHLKALFDCTFSTNFRENQVWSKATTMGKICEEDDYIRHNAICKKCYRLVAESVWRNCNPLTTRQWSYQLMYFCILEFSPKICYRVCMLGDFAYRYKWAIWTKRTTLSQDRFCCCYGMVRY